MCEPANSANATHHALLVLLGQYAQHLGLTEALMRVPMGQKTYCHRPQTKVLEFLLAILAGLPHLADLSRAGAPLDQDQAVATAWQQAGWADYSGVARTLQQLTQAEAEACGQVLQTVSRPFIAAEITAALKAAGRLVYDGDLTGRPVSDTSTTYPEAAYGYMDGDVRLGYQAAVVSLTSPTYGRLTLAVQPHPGQLVSCQAAQALVLAGEAATGVRPLRRTHLVAARLTTLTTLCAEAERRVAAAHSALTAAEAELAQRQAACQTAEADLAALEGAYQAAGRLERPHGQLARMRRQVAAGQTRCVQQAARIERIQNQCRRSAVAQATRQAEASAVAQRLADLTADNAANPGPVAAVFRLDAGFGTWENVAWLIEMGYEVYTRPFNHQITEALRRRTGADTSWTPVGRNAEMVAWPADPLHGCPYPADLALARYHTGATQRYSVFLHYGEDAACADLAQWFAVYNARQTIEAGIKEGKGVFAMHHLKVRHGPALWLQEQFAAFAANFLRWAAHWLRTDCPQEPPHWLEQAGCAVKTLVQVMAHTPADIGWLPHGCLLKFTAASVYAGCVIQTGGWAFQLSLPLFQCYRPEPFSTIRPLIAQNLR